MKILMLRNFDDMAAGEVYGVEPHVFLNMPQGVAVSAEVKEPVEGKPLDPTVGEGEPIKEEPIKPEVKPVEEGEDRAVGEGDILTR